MSSRRENCCQILQTLLGIQYSRNSLCIVIYSQHPCNDVVMISMIHFLDTTISCSVHSKLLGQLDYQNSFSACASFWTCCSDTNPCKINEGDCDSDNHCIGNLRCGVGNCGSMYPSNSDCCEEKGR